MGFRFRKSIPIGKHFRINLSKSGVGYSCGVKGARFTKTANGKNRTTLSVPGTGISYTTESKAHTSRKKPSKKKNVDQAAASAKQQVQQTAGAQNPPANSAPTKSSFNITSFKTTHPVWFWILAIAFWPVSLSIWFLKTDSIKRLNKTARICLLAAFWVVFCTVGGIAGTQKGPGDIQLSDPISKITSKASPAPTATPEPTPTPEPSPTPEPTSTPVPETAKPSAAPPQTQQGTQNNTVTPGNASGSGGQTAPQPANEANYVLNTSTHKFHRPTCGDVDKIAAGNLSNVYDSRSNLIAQGYAPCGHCHP